MGWTGVFSERTGAVAQALLRLASVRRDFATRYQAMLDEVLRLRRPTAIRTIYDVRFPDPDFREVAVTALALLNDAITRDLSQGER